MQRIQDNLPKASNPEGISTFNSKSNPVMIEIEKIISFSSENEKFRATNLVGEAGVGGKWLASPQEALNPQAYITLQLKRPVEVAIIELGTVWCATIQVQVGRSDWPQGRPLLTLLPTSCLMTPQESCMGTCIYKTRLFGSAEFDSEVVKNKWDIMKIICRQPFRRNVQVGLSFVGVKPVEAPVSEVHCAPKSTPKSVEAILDHFFGNMPSRQNKRKPLRTRGARLVMAAIRKNRENPK
ncbi:protein XNDC1N-like [Crassostrea virginica]